MANKKEKRVSEEELEAKEAQKKSQKNYYEKRKIMFKVVGWIMATGRLDIAYVYGIVTAGFLFCMPLPEFQAGKCGGVYLVRDCCMRGVGVAYDGEVSHVEYPVGASRCFGFFQWPIATSKQYCFLLLAFGIRKRILYHIHLFDVHKRATAHDGDVGVPDGMF